MTSGRLAIAVSLLIVSGSRCTSGPPSASSLTPKIRPPKVTGPLQTRGTRITGPNGRSVRFVGINLQGMQISNDAGSRQPDTCGRAWRVPPQGAAENIATWGFNAVRLPIGWANIEPEPPTTNPDGSLTHHWSEEYLKALDGVIASLRKEGVAVILDPAQFQWSSAFKETGLSSERVDCEGYGMPAWLNPNAQGETIDQARCDFMADRAEPGVPQSPWGGLSAVWTMLGRRYAHNDAIIAADTFNEPYFVRPDCGGADFPGFFKMIGTAIRAVAPRWLLIFEYLPTTSQAFGLNSPPPFADQVYSIHVYARDWDSAQQLMDPAWSQAQRWNMPLFVGEFSAFGATSPRGGIPNWQDQTMQMLDYMKQRGISWTVFGYAGGLSIVNRDGTPKADVISVLQQGF